MLVMQSSGLTRGVTALLAGLILAAGALPALSGQADIPLEIALISYDEQTGRTEFQVISRSKTPIVAWKVAIIVRCADGMELVGGLTRDYWQLGSDEYLQGGGEDTAVSTLAPQCKNAGLANPRVGLSPVFVILSNGRSIGNREAIDTLYASRSGEVAEACRIRQILHDALEQAKSPADLKSALVAADDQIREEPPATKKLFPDKVHSPASSAISWNLGEMFTNGSLFQRKQAVQFVDSLKGLLGSSPLDKGNRARALLGYEVARYDRYCGDGMKMLREQDLNRIRRLPDTHIPQWCQEKQS